MLEAIKYATVSKIYIKKLIFYNPDKTAEQKKLCADYGITYLPGKDKKSCYRLVDGEFQLSKISDNLICYPFDRIFDDATLLKFEKGNHDEVMFVMEDNLIKGVVHIVDYNHEFINYEFFKATYRFERMLRELLILKEESNETLLEWMKGKSKKSSHWENRYEQCVPPDKHQLQIEENKRRDFNPFQTFYLNDLLFFVASRKYVSLEFKRRLEAIKSVRNWVAHNKDLAHKSDGDNFPLYRIDELKTFVNHANDFFKCYEELEELITNIVYK